jgi:uncharacterized membrane protein YccC
VQEKIGISNFLWSFAAEASTKARRDEQHAREVLEATSKEADELTSELKAARAGCTDVEARKQVQDAIEQLSLQIAALKEEKAALAVVDPERFEALKQAAKIARDSANRRALRRYRFSFRPCVGSMTR